MLNKRSELLATVELEAATHEMPEIKELMKIVLEAGAYEIILCRNKLKRSTKFSNEEKAFIIQLDAASSMFQIKMRGLIII